MKISRLAIALCLLALIAHSNSAIAQQNGQDSYQLAKQIVASQVSDEMRHKAGDTLMLMITPLVSRDNPGQDDKIKAIMQQTVVPVMDSSFDEVMQQTAGLYVENFSADELRQLLAFLSSPLGQKYKKFNLDIAQKIKDNAKSAGTAKAQEAIHTLVAQLKLNNMHVPKELDH